MEHALHNTLSRDHTFLVNEIRTNLKESTGKQHL